MTDLDTDLGSWLARRREEAGLSQEALAVQLRTEQPTISKIERGQRRVTVSGLIQWAIALDLDVETLGSALSDLADRHFPTKSLRQR